MQMNMTKYLIVTALFAGIIDIGATLPRAQTEAFVLKGNAQQ